jgi:hypothetical protein
MGVFGRCLRSWLDSEVLFTLTLRLGWSKMQTRLSFWFNLIYAIRKTADSKPMNNFGPW